MLQVFTDAPRKSVRGAFFVCVSLLVSALQPPPIWAGLSPGRYAVGISSIKTSDVEITYWYPASNKGRPQTVRDLASSPATFARDADIDGLDETLIRRYGDQRLFATHGAKPLSGRRPLVVFAQGNQQRPLHQAVLAEFLASHAFVVASGASTTIDAPMKSAEDVGLAAQRETERLQLVFGIMTARPEVDATHVGVAGHSFGARAALLIAMHEPSIRALVSLDGGIGTAQSMDSYRRASWFRADAEVPPVLHLYETNDAFMAPDFTLLKSLRLRGLKLQQIDGLRHVHFTTLGFAAAADPELQQAVGMTPSGPAGLKEMANATLAFLESHLR